MILQFESWELDAKHNVAIDIPSSPAGPIALHSWEWTDGRECVVPPGGSAVVLPTHHTTVGWPGCSASLSRGCYAQVPGGAVIAGGAGLIIHTPAYVGLPQFGGPVEALGRLRYIDGCSDSLLICPSRLGEPCLNLLHLPPGTEQTQHTHPSDRIGIILRGEGQCKTPDGTWDLRPGMFWYIPPEWRHSFHTAGESLDVLAWHPDSDFGPSHDWHPMLNRTIVDGLPAHAPANTAIRTTAIDGAGS